MYFPYMSLIGHFIQLHRVFVFFRRNNSFIAPPPLSLSHFFLFFPPLDFYMHIYYFNTS